MFFNVPAVLSYIRSDFEVQAYNCTSGYNQFLVQEIKIKTLDESTKKPIDASVSSIGSSKIHKSRRLPKF